MKRLRSRKPASYTMPTNIGDDAAANLAFFLLENSGSIFGLWRGPMKAVDQRKLFGSFLGKGTLSIDGGEERVTMVVSVCFGLDWEKRHDIPWRDL